MARTMIDKAMEVDLEDADDYNMVELLLLLLIFFLCSKI